MKAVGVVDVIGEKRVVGWVRPLDIEDPPDVGLWVGWRKVAEMAADLPRRDLVEHGIHPTGQAGFEFLLPENKSIKRGQLVQVKILKTGEKLLPDKYRYSGGIRVFLLHIPKTAGSSLNWYFEQCLGKAHCATHVESKRHLLAKARIYSFSYVSGHYKLPHFHMLDTRNEFKGITILRDPMEQLSSHLRWNKTMRQRRRAFRLLNDPLKDATERLEKLDLDDADALAGFFATMSEAERNLFDNCQTRYLLRKPAIDLNGHHLTTAIKGLESMAFVGITEQFQRSVDALSRMFGLPRNEQPIRRNVNEQLEAALRSPAARERVADLTRFDQILYDRGLQLFEEQCAALGV